MTDSICERALQAVEDRLAVVLKSASYNTDAGRRVFRARRKFDKPQLPCFAVFSSGETTDEGAGNHRGMMIRLSIDVECHIEADRDDSGKALELLKADAKKALLRLASPGLSDSAGRIGPLAYIGASANPREDGASTESVTLHLITSYKEGYGDPYTNKA